MKTTSGTSKAFKVVLRRIGKTKIETSRVFADSIQDARVIAEEDFPAYDVISVKPVATEGRE